MRLINESALNRNGKFDHAHRACNNLCWPSGTHIVV